MTRAGFRAIAPSVLLAFVLGAAGPAAAAVLEADAVLGEPWGVGRLVLDLSAGELPQPLGAEGLGLSEKNGRVLYPAIHSPGGAALIKQFVAPGSPLTSGGPVREQVGGILRGLMNRPSPTTLHFLFRGSEPLELSLHARQSIPLVIQPRPNPAMHARWLQDWWRDYAAPEPLLKKKPDFPPVVETYLVNSLARRLNLRLPEHKKAGSAQQQFVRELGLTVGSESIRTALEQDRLLGLTNLDLPADQPLPLDQPQPPPAAPAPPSDVKIEPIAQHVPAECFYIRFGTFSNFLWFQDTMDEWGGDLANLVAQRGLDNGRNGRIQEQLVLQQSQLARILGPAVISDVAMIGTDMLFQDGPAIGFLFEANNNMLLGSDFSGKRSDRVKKGGASEEKLKIEGQEVSYLSSPDGSVRSYYARSGDYHFVTTSKALATRFLQTAKGKGSLGANAAFRQARTVVPVSRDDSVFIYLSDAFFENLTSPHYRIEMLRRLEAATDIDVVLLAKLCAATEGKRGDTIEDLVACGLLPPGFGPRPDGSRAVVTRTEVYDQQRGRRGLFVPVPDVPVVGITRAEAESYRGFAEMYRDKWGHIEPILVAVQRKDLADRREQIVVDARMTPLERQRVEMLRKLAGTADKQSFAAIPGNAVAFEAILTDQRLFGGLRDVAPPLDLLSGGLFTLQKFRDAIIGYLGSQGQRGLLGVLDITFPPPGPDGFSRNPLGLWRLLSGPSALYSFQPDVLAGVAPQLRFEPAPRSAQLRLHVGDVSGARITPFINNLGYARTRDTTLGNLRLLAALREQLHVPPKDCRDAAELLLGAKLICPLGGKYILRDVPGGLSRWTSTKLDETAAGQTGLQIQAPSGYVAPPLSWFRGLDLDAAFVSELVSAHAEIIMQKPAAK